MEEEEEALKKQREMTTVNNVKKQQPTRVVTTGVAQTPNNNTNNTQQQQTRNQEPGSIAQPDSNTFKNHYQDFGDAVPNAARTSERTENAEEKLPGEEFEVHQTEEKKEEINDD